MAEHSGRSIMMLKIIKLKETIKVAGQLIKTAKHMKIFLKTHWSIEEGGPRGPCPPPPP